MRAIALCLALAAPPALAQDASPEMREGADLLGRGLQLLAEGLLREVAPALEELNRLADELDAYEAPEMMPNGDIIIRRKAPLAPEGETDL